MKKKNHLGRPIKSNNVKVVAVPREDIDIEKLAQALFCIAKDIAKKKTSLSQPEKK